MFDLQKKKAATLVLITHDQTLAEKCKLVFHMDDGHLKKGGKKL